MSTETTFSFCESVHATGTSPWHIRKLTSVGKKPTGGIDGPSLCGRVKSPGGWDLEVEFSDKHFDHACRSCVDEYRKQSTS